MIDATERAELEELRLATRLAGVTTWSFVDSLDPVLAIHPDDEARVLAALRACLDGTTERFEQEYRTPGVDGAVAWKLGRGVVVHDVARPARVVATSVDITRLKQVEEEARIDSDRLTLAAEIAGFAITEYDLRGATDREHAVTMIERNVRGQRRWPPIDASGDDHRQAMLPEDLPGAKAAARDSVIGVTPEMHVEYRTRNSRDGSVRWRLGRGKCYYDERGAPIRYIGVSHDITRVKEAEEGSRRAEEHLKLATRLSGVVAWSVAVEGGDLSSGKIDHARAWESLGYPAGDGPSSLDAAIGERVNAEDRERMRGDFQDCVDGKTEQVDGEYRVRHRDGSERWYLVRGVGVRSVAGHVNRLTGTAVDVTRLKLAEEDARFANERLELAARLSGFAVTECDLRGARSADEAAALIVSDPTRHRRWPPPKPDETDFRETVLPEDLPRTRAALFDSISGKLAEGVVEYRTVSPRDGAVRWRLGRGKCYRDANGVPVRYIGVSVDTQELKAAQEELRRAVEAQRLATQLSGVYGWNVEVAGDDLAMARVGLLDGTERLGYTLPEDLSEGLAQVVVPEDLARVRADLRACIDGKLDQIDGEYRVRTRDGSLRWNLSRGLPVRDETGRVIRVLGTSVDITRLKQVEEELRAAKDRLDLAAKLVGFTITEIDLKGEAEVGRLGELLKETVVPEDLPRALERFHAVLRAGPNDEEPRPTLEFRTRGEDGSIRWRAGHAKCFYDGTGAPVRYVIVSYDIQNIKAAEEDAKRAMQRLEISTRLSGIHVWSYDLDGVHDPAHATTGRNDNSVLHSLGYGETSPATLGGRLLTVVHPTDRERVAGAVADCVAGKTPMLDMECRFVGRNGSVHWKIVRGLVTRDEDGRALTFAGTVVDIDQLKHTQQELQLVRERLERAVTASGACTWDFEITNGDLLTAVPVFTNAWELAGYAIPAEPDQVAQVAAVTMLPEDLQAHNARVQAFMDGTGRDWETELRIVHKDGGIRHHLSRGVVERDALGRAIRFTGTNIDVTTSKAAEQRLLASEERFRRTFENAAVGMILADVDGRLLEFNARFCEFLGYSREELAGRKFVEFMVPEEVAEDLERHRRVVAGEIASFTRDKQYVRKDGVTVWGNVTVSLLQRHGSPQVMAILQDITERKALEAQIESGRKRIELALRGSDISVYQGDFLDPDPANAEWTYFNMWEPLGFGDAEPEEFEQRKGIALHPDDAPLVVEKFAAAAAVDRVGPRAPRAPSRWLRAVAMVARDARVR